jgi:hypothetical protein
MPREPAREPAGPGEIRGRAGLLGPFASWFLVLGFWFLVLGAWFLVFGCDFFVFGFWFFVLGLWFPRLAMHTYTCVRMHPTLSPREVVEAQTSRRLFDRFSAKRPFPMSPTDLSPT